MARRPDIRITTGPRRLACGHRVGRGATIVRRPGGSWLCSACQPWLPVKSVAQVLAEAAATGDGEATANATAKRDAIA